MAISNASTSNLRSAIEQAIHHFTKDDDFLVITDFHLHLDSDTGEVSIADDTDVAIASAVVEEWIDLDGDDELEEMIGVLTALLHQMLDEHVFDHVNVSKPFSFVLEDDNKESIQELFYVDEDIIVLNNDLLKDMDKDLDDFFEKLMKE